MTPGARKLMDRVPKIKVALLEYQEARKQHNDILGDLEIQALFYADKNKEAHDLIASKHPMGEWITVQTNAYKLINLVFENVPGAPDDPQKVWGNPRIFDEMVILAEKMIATNDRQRKTLLDTLNAVMA